MLKMCVQKFLVNKKQREKCLKIYLQNNQNDYKTKHKKVSKQFKQFNVILNRTSKFTAMPQTISECN